MIAYAYRFKSGDIGIVNDDGQIPHGAGVFASGDGAEIRAQVEVKARLAYDGKTLLLPGVPEAAESDEFVAFEQWHGWAFIDQGWHINLLEGSL